MKKDFDSAQEQIIKKLNETGDIFSQYTYLISLSAKLPEMSEDERKSSVTVDKCQSQVWIKIDFNNDGTIRMSADSDTLIVKSVLYLMKTLIDNRTPEEIENVEFDFIQKTELIDTFSDTRLNGFNEILKTIKAQSRCA